MSRTKVQKKLNQLMSDTIDVISDTANLYAPGDKELWNDCVKVYRNNIRKLFSDLQESCNNIITTKRNK